MIKSTTNFHRFNSTNSFEIRVPVSRNVVEVTRHDYGGLTRKESLIENVINCGLAVLSILLCGMFGSPGFAIIWVLVLGLVAVTPLGSFLSLKLFARRPRSTTIRYEGADVPQELVERYQKAEADFMQARKDLDALPLKGEI